MTAVICGDGLTGGGEHFQQNQVASIPIALRDLPAETRSPPLSSPPDEYVCSRIRWANGGFETDGTSTHFMPDALQMPVNKHSAVGRISRQPRRAPCRLRSKCTAAIAKTSWIETSGLFSSTIPKPVGRRHLSRGPTRACVRFTAMQSARDS